MNGYKDITNTFGKQYFSWNNTSTHLFKKHDIKTTRSVTKNLGVILIDMIKGNGASASAAAAGDKSGTKRM